MVPESQSSGFFFFFVLGISFGGGICICINQGFRLLEEEEGYGSRAYVLYCVYLAAKSCESSDRSSPASVCAEEEERR